MKTLFIVLYLLLIQLSFGQVPPLFKITENDRVGYINDQGKVVIKPIYLNGNDFSEGLAAVRLNGTYGFINETGTFVIKPVYDLATNFVNGLAVVYKDGEPLFIDKKGNVVLPTVFNGLTFLDSRKAVVTTLTGKQGVIDVHTKQLLIDTVFSSIGEFRNGLAIVEESRTRNKGKKRTGVIDTRGKFVVPFGKYEDINPFCDGYAVVEIDDKANDDGSTDGVIDTKGNLLFKRPYKNFSYVDGDFHDGLAKVSLYQYWIPEKKGVSATSEKAYEGFINLKGEVVFDDPNCKYVKEFSNGRAFIKRNNDFILVDRNFQRVGDKVFDDIPNETFKDGYAIVETDDGLGIIDTSGNFVTRSNYDDIDMIGIVDGYFFFKDESKTLYGIANLQGKVICEPILQEFDRNGFVNGLIKTVIDERLSYINKTGKIVWEQQDDTFTTLRPLNIDFMNRGYFYAYSTPENKDSDDSGGWAVSPNVPTKIKGNRFQKNSFAITIDTNATATFANDHLGFKLFISNTTADTVKFNAQDSRLYLKLQAQDNNGDWRDIEYLPSSWCGNSYHKIQLEPGSYWNFTIPKYSGEFQTKIRAELKYIYKDKARTDKVIYSNIIEGSINPGQFWNKRTYYPGGLMDPYND